MFNTRLFQMPSLFYALRYSYGIAASKTQAARAQALAPSVQEIRPYIYKAGSCQVSLWSMSCTCKEQRTRHIKNQPFKPCVHFLAVYLAGHWCPIFNPTETTTIKEPQVLARFCRATLPACYPPASLGFEILEAVDGWATLRNLATNTHASAPVSALNRFVVLYE